MATLVAAHSRGAARAIVAALALGFSLGALATPSLEALQAGSAHLQLDSAPYDLSLGASVSSLNARAVSMASADFNSDGYADLVSGFAQAGGGFIAVHRGNPEAYSPTTSTAFANLKQGIYPPGFVNEGQIRNLPVVPELLLAGDLNADGEPDVLFAQRGDDAIYFLPGSPSGFGPALKIALNGTVDAIGAGEIDFPNGSMDVVVAISSESGSSLNIYRDGIANMPLNYPVPAAVTQLAVGNLDDSLMGAVAMLADGKVSILHGYDQREGVPGFNRLEALGFAAQIQAFALGNFIWDREAKTELALLQADGTLAIAGRGALNTHPFSLNEVREKRRAQIATQSVTLKHWQPGDGGTWTVNETLTGVVSKGLAMRGATLVRANLAGQAADDLIVVDSLNQTLKLLTMEGAQRKRYSVNSTSEPVAVLAQPTSSFALPSLIVLGKGAAAASILPSAPSATFTVSKTADTNDGACNADCSLREAISAANATAGADSIVLPAGTYQLTIANSANTNEDNNATGDLDVNDALTITGAGSATTIVRAGTTTSNGIDKVFAFNPICVSPMATAISGITVSFGRNTQPTTAPDFSYSGGGMDWCGTGNSSMTVTNSVFDSNTNTTGYGGGINLDSFAANGTASITGSTISGNRTLSTVGSSTGGGVNLFADQHSVTFTNSTISGNTATREGGGLFVRHTNGGAVLVQGSTISNNTAASRGGGVSSTNLGVSTFTINQDSVVSGNTSQGLAGLAAEGGGIYSNSAATTTINEVTITGNSATGAGVSEQRGGGGIATGGGTVNVTFNRIVGNTALGLGGSGIHKDSNAGTTTATNNWWGCNAGAGSAPCDRAVLAAGAGTLVTTPHLVLNHAASPTIIVVGQTSALTADFLTNSASGAIAVANLDAIVGTAHAHNNPVLGILSASQSAIQAGGIATATFTATAAGAGSADSVVDSQTRTAAITISKANTVTTITSDAPDPSTSGSVIAVNYAVAVSAPGAGTPSGNVVVTISGGAETCTGTVAAGTCNITLTTLGSRTLIAAYAGDANFNPSSATDPHTVVNPTNVSIAVAPASVNEDGATDLVYTVTRDSNLVTATVVNITTSGTAVSGTDYTGGVASVTIPANGTTATITINPTADATIEANETVILAVAAGAGYSVGAPAQATGTILNDDVPNVFISVAPASVAEDGASDLIYTVTFDQASLSSTSINFSIGGTATSGTDYAAVASPLVIPAGNLSGTVTVTPTTDTTIEADETVTLSLVAGAGYTVRIPDNATGIILNDDLPTLTINDVALAEGNAGASNATFTVSLSAPVGPGGVTFDIATANGTATAGTDYVAQSLTAQTIPMGSSTYTFTVAINGDTLNEPNETFFVNVSNVTNAIVADAQGQGTITNDDALPSLSIGNATLIEGNAGSANMGFTVTLSAASGQTVTVNYATADGTATSGSDFTTASGTLTFTPGQTTQQINVAVLGDTTPESNETFTVALTAPTNAIVATGAGTGTIIDDDTTLSINDVTIAEGNTGTMLAAFTVSLSQPAGPGGVTFDIATANGTATAGSDYVAQSLTAQTIPTGTSTYTFNVAINGDTLNELDETFFVNVSNVTNAGITDGQGQGTITNDDAVPSLSIGNATLIEGNAGSANMGFTVTLSAASGQTVTVNYATADGSATSGSDFTSASGTLTFTPGQTTQQINVAVLGDTTPESNETFTVALTAPANAIVATGTGTGTIIDDDTTLSINDVTIAEGNTGTTPATFTVSLSQPAGPGGVTFDIATANGTATAGTDYVAQSLTAQTIPTGTSTYTFNVAINGDTLNELDETFFVNVTNVINAGISDAQGQGTITNDDAVPSLSIGNVVVVEGNAGTAAATFTVTLSAASGQTVTVNYVTADGTATSGSDYVPTSGTLTFTAGQTTQPINVTVNGDIVSEADETFTVDLSTASNASIAVATGTGTITNDDVPVTVSPGTLPPATVAAAYAQTIGASGGAGPYTFAITAGTLPAGITLSAAGALAGMPTAGGAFNFTVTATDSSPLPGPFTGSQAYTLTVNAPTIVLPAATLPDGVTAIPYTANLPPATGGTAPYSYAVTAGALPSGILMDTAGAFSGTPTAGGAFNFTVTATDSSTGTGPYIASRAYSIAITAITIDPPTLPAGTAGTAYTQTLTANGGSAPYTFSVSAGALPAGLTLSGAGVLSGTPTAAGTFNLTVSVLDSASAPATQAYTLTIATSTLILAPTTLSAGTAGVAYAQTITASGGIAPYTYLVTTGALPAGLALSTGGNLAGTPTVAGSFNFSITATDSTSGTAGTGNRAYTLDLAAPIISMAAGQLPPPILNAPYNATLIATGGTAPYTYAVTAGTLPAGLSLSAAGVLSGIPSTVGPATFTITATDALGFSGTQVFNLSVQLLATAVPVDSPLALAILVFGLWLAGLFFLRRRKTL